MFRVGFYQFSKKRNATQTPPDSSGVVYLDCRAVDDTGVLAPEVIVHTSHNPTSWNYAYIPQFRRFYWVEEWTAHGALWIASLKVDVLGSWIEEIEATDFYVLRASQESDGEIRDTLYPVSANPNRHVDTAESVFTSIPQQGMYVIGVTGGASTVGPSYYVMTVTQFVAFLQYLGDSSSGQGGFYAEALKGISEIGENLQKALINPFQYLTSVMLFPCKVPTAEATQSIPYGWWRLKTPARSLANILPIRASTTFTLAKHPQSSSRGMYLNGEPYTSLMLEYPPFPTLKLNASDYADVESLHCDVVVDPITGLGTLRVSPSNASETCTNFVSAQVGVRLPVSQLAYNVHETANALSGVMGDLMSLNPLGSLIGLANAATSSALPQVQSMGGQDGSMSQYVRPPRLSYTYWWVAEDDNASRGRPLLKNRKLPALGSGYVQVADGDIDAPATKRELDEIKALLEGGIYYNA